MRRHRAPLFVGLLLLIAIPPLAVVAGTGQDETEDIWEDGSGRGRRDRRSWWFSEEAVDRIIAGIRERDPDKAKELSALRERDPELFRSELGKYGRKEIEEISRERWEARRRKMLDDFVKWLKANYPEEEKSLSSIRETNPQLYIKNSEHLLEKYGRIFQADMTNPELGTVLKEDLELKEKRDELLRRLRSERSEARKQAIGSELQDVVSRRYDLIVRRKEIAYEQLQQQLEELQRQIRDSKEEITRWQDTKLKQENVRRRLESLTQDKMGFKWD